MGNMRDFDACHDLWQREGKIPPNVNWKLSQFYETGDRRLGMLRYHISPASLFLWNMLMSEETRLHDARKNGRIIVGAMKDLGTIPVLMSAFENTTTFYPDGAWWLPCFKQRETNLLDRAAELGVGEGICPVRTMLAAFEDGYNWPIPDLLFSSVGAICDDFSAVVQRLHELGHTVHFWEIPHGRLAEAGENVYVNAQGKRIPWRYIELVAEEFQTIVQITETATHEKMNDAKLATAIREANHIRSLIHTLRMRVYASETPLFPALEMMVMEMFALHFCSDRIMCRAMLEQMVSELLDETQVLPVANSKRAPIFWVNPTADLYAMTLLEDCGARLAGTEFMFMHALDLIPEDLPPLQALAVAALSDLMTQTMDARAERILQDVQRFGARGIVVSRIPGASHCAFESKRIRDYIQQRTSIPLVDLEIESVCGGTSETLRTRLEALVESILN